MTTYLPYKLHNMLVAGSACVAEALFLGPDEQRVLALYTNCVADA